MSPDYETEQALQEKQAVDEEQDAIPDEPREFDLLDNWMEEF